MNNEVVEQVEMLVKDVINNSIHTAMPGKVVSVNDVSGLMSVQPIGSFYCGKKEMDYPVVSGVPICVTANSKGASICSPIKAGDSVLLICAEQSLSAFISDTTDGQSNEKFELTNCIAIPGIQRSMPDSQKEANNKDAVVVANGNIKILIMKDGIEVTDGGGMEIHISNGKVSIEGKVVIKGDLKVEGSIDAVGNIKGANLEG